MTARSFSGRTTGEVTCCSPAPRPAGPPHSLLHIQRARGPCASPSWAGVELWTDSRRPPQPRLSVAGSWHLISGAPRGGLWARACRSLPLRGALWPCRLQRGVPRGSPALLPEPGPSVRRPPGRLCPGVSAVLNHTYSVLRPPCSPLRPASPCRGSSTAGGQGRVYQRGGRRLLEELRGS